MHPDDDDFGVGFGCGLIAMGLLVVFMTIFDWLVEPSRTYVVHEYDEQGNVSAEYTTDHINHMDNAIRFTDENGTTYVLQEKYSYKKEEKD